jgi:hypothetical protein
MDDQSKLVRVRLGTAGVYKHFYGHDQTLKGLEGNVAPAHLVLTLDTRDPLLARLDLGLIPRFRLVHPYRYDHSEMFAYRQADGVIEFLEPGLVYEASDWPYDEYPARFENVPATLEIEEPPPGNLKTDYGSDGNGKGCNLHSPYTYWYPEGAGNAVFLGPMQKTIQGPQFDCPVCVKQTRLIARVPDQADGAKEATWRNCGVYTLFWYCDPCQIVVTHNEV